MNRIIHLKKQIACITGLALLASTAAYVSAEVAENVFGTNAVVATATNTDTAIKNLTAVSAVSTIAVNWDAVETADLYKVYVYGSDGKLKVSQTVTENAATFTSKKIAGQTCTVTVWAVVDGVAQEKSSVTTTPADTSIQQLTATASYDVSSGKSTISVNWKAVLGATEYKVTVYDSNESSVTEDRVTTNSASFTSDELFLAGRNYSVEVCAYVGFDRKQATTTQVVWDIDESIAILNIDYSDADITYVPGSVGSGPAAQTTIRSTSSKYADMIKDLVKLVGEPGKRVSVNVDYDDYLDELPYEDDYYVFTSSGFRIDDLDFIISKEGFTFKGWYIKNADGTETALDTSTYTYFEEGITYVYAKFWPEGVPDELPDVTGVQATASYDETSAKNSITVSWDEASGVDGYKVRFRNAAGTQIGARAVTGTSCTAAQSNFASGSTVTVVVCAYIGDLEGPLTSVTVDIPASDATDTTIKNLTATAEDSTISVNWTAVTGAQQYKVYVYDSNGAFKASKAVTTNSASLTSAKLFLPGETYTVTVWAVIDGVAQEKSSVEVTMHETGLDTTIKNLTATATADSTISVNWTAVTGAAKYKVYVYDSSGTFKASKPVTTNSASFTSATLFLPGETYTIKVWAVVNAVAQEPSSVEVTIPAKFIEVRNLVASAVTGYVTASWDAVDGATKYDIYYYNEAGKKLASKTVTDTSYTTSFMRGVVTGETITVQVRATLADDTVTEFTSATAVVGIGTPEDLTATKSGTTVTASWTALAGVDGYAVYFRDASGKILGSTLVTTNSVSSTATNFGTDVYVTVMAYTLDENGDKMYGALSESVKAE